VRIRHRRPKRPRRATGPRRPGGCRAMTRYSADEPVAHRFWLLFLHTPMKRHPDDVTSRSPAGTTVLIGADLPFEAPGPLLDEHPVAARPRGWVILPSRFLAPLSRPKAQGTGRPAAPRFVDFPTVTRPNVLPTSPAQSTTVMVRAAASIGPRSLIAYRRPARVGDVRRDFASANVFEGHPTESQIPDDAARARVDSRRFWRKRVGG